MYTCLWLSAAKLYHGPNESIRCSIPDGNYDFNFGHDLWKAREMLEVIAQIPDLPSINILRRYRVWKRGRFCVTLQGIDSEGDFRFSRP